VNGNEGVPATAEDLKNLLDELDILAERITDWTAGAHLAYDHLKGFIALNTADPGRKEDGDGR
jgi:hypothetical protein